MPVIKNISGTAEFVAGPVSYIGAVIRLGEHNYADDSDFYAQVWDAEQAKPVEVYTWSTRGAGCSAVATVDATPEVTELYRAYREMERQARDNAAQAARDAEPARGKTVAVARGRKIAQGTTGTVIWYGAAKSYSYNAPIAYRVGIKLADDSVVFTAAKNVDVIQDDDTSADDGERARTGSSSCDR